MGFDVNFSNHKPVIKEAQATHDGGAGNLGYFEQGEKQKEKERDRSIFKEENTQDTFGRRDDDDLQEESFSVSKFIAQIILAIKDWWGKLFPAR